MCARYSYLKLKKRISIFFQNFFPQILFFHKFFLKNLFLDFVVQKSFLTKIFFVVAEMILTSEVHCILVSLPLVERICLYVLLPVSVVKYCSALLSTALRFRKMFLDIDQSTYNLSQFFISSLEDQSTQPRRF